jgi:uncharacterized protein YbjT (DUF2867 family)
MRVVIAGGHGKIALRLEQLLAGRGDTPIGLVRNPDHAADLAEAGASALVRDLERVSAADLAADLAGADAVVFAAGAGPNSGSARKDTVDRGASALLADAAVEAGVRRFLQISAMGLGRVDRLDPDDVFTIYLRAKDAAERELRERDLDWTILRPGALTDEPGTGLVTLGTSVSGVNVPRADVAAVLLALLDAPETAGMTVELLSGSVPVVDAVRNLTA